MVVDWTYSVVMSYVRDEQDAEEIIQDTLLATISGIENFRNQASIKTWVYRIAINKSKDFLKYKHRQKRAGKVISLHRNELNDGADYEPADFWHPGLQMESKEKLDIIFRAINELPANQKKALILNKLEHLKIQEIADIMELSYKAVESLLLRSRQNLKKYLDTEGIYLMKKGI